MITRNTHIVRIARIFTTTALGLTLISGCESTQKPETKVTDSAAKANRAPVVTLAGVRITFRPDDSSVGILKLGKAEYQDVTITTTAPARVILTTVTAPGSGVSVPVFETADLTQLYTDYTKAKQDVARSTHEFERLKDLFAHNAVAGKDVTQAEADRASAEATLAGIESRMLTAGLSPAELSKMKPDASILIANVPEAEISSVQMGEDVQIVFDSWKGETLHGRVLDIGHAVDPTTRTFNVRIELVNHDRMIRPGMFASASFGVDVARRFVVPQSAVVSVQGKSFVFVTNDGHSFERREVTLGQQSKDYFIVLGGLSDGEQVVTDGAVLLKGISFGS